MSIANNVQGLQGLQGVPMPGVPDAQAQGIPHPHPIPPPHDTRNVQIPATVLSPEYTDILQRLKKINDGYFFKPDKILVNQLKAITPIELSKVLRQFFIIMVQEERIKDPEKFLDRLATLIPLTKMQEAANIQDTLQEAREMFNEAKYYLELTEKHPPSIKARISFILDGIISVIDNIITAFGIGGFFQHSDSELHADMKSQKIMILFSFFGMITSTLLPILGAETGAKIVGGIFLGIAALSIIWPRIKPKPRHLPARAENWTKKAQQGECNAQGRKESLDAIANILKMNRHPILVGLSRVGKSLTAKALAEAIERGDYPELKGKVIFGLNTAKLVGYQGSSFLGGGNDILDKISEQMGCHRNDIILVLDEVHMACKKNEKMADQLKTFLDKNGEFPHVIGITTVDEYRHVSDNQAFSLRFDRVDIKNTNEDETLKILSDAVLKDQAQLLVKEGALKYLYDKSFASRESPQPSSALNLLERCINKTRKTQISNTEQRIIDVSNQILSLRAQAVASHSRRPEVRAQIAELEQQMQALQEALAQEKKELDHIFTAQGLLARVTKATYASVLKISGIAKAKLVGGLDAKIGTKMNTKSEKQAKMFLLLHEFLGRSLEAYIEEKAQHAKKLGVRVVLDRELIDEVAVGVQGRA